MSTDNKVAQRIMQREPIPPFADAPMVQPEEIILAWKGHDDTPADKARALASCRPIKADPADRHMDPERDISRPQRYRSRPVVIEAMLFTNEPANVLDVIEWMQLQFVGQKAPAYPTPSGLIIETLEGEMLASPGDYIIMGTALEFYPCKPAIFKHKYEEV